MPGLARKLLNRNVIEKRKGGEFAVIWFLAARKSLILAGEMSEWLKEHAWKAKRASDIEPLRRTSRHTRSATWLPKRSLDVLP